MRTEQLGRSHFRYLFAGASHQRSGVKPSANNQADPLVCNAALAPLQVVAYITDTVAIRRILDHLGLSRPEKPPPEVREVFGVPVDDEGREIGANPA